MQAILEANCVQLPADRARIVQNNIARHVFQESGGGANQFPGSLPVTLSRETLRTRLLNRYQYQYMATPKADGERYFLVVGPHGELMLYARNKSIWMIRNARAPPGITYCLLDGELVLLRNSESAQHRASPTALAFLCCDALQWNAETMVGKPLLERLEVARKFCERFGQAPAEQTNNALWSIRFKDYYDLASVHRGYLQQELGALDYAIDGFVFVDAASLYNPRTDWEMFKWKPRIQMNTVDFQLEYFQARDETVFYVRADTGRGPVSNVEKHRCPGNALLEHFQRSESCIVECEPAVRGSELAWKPVKIRHDKTLPNFQSVYDDACLAVREAIGFQEIFNTP